MTIKKTIALFCDKKKVYPPFTRKKIEKAGYNVADFLLEMRDELKKADDVKIFKHQKILKAFFNSCEDLM